MEEDTHFFTLMPMSQNMSGLKPGETYTGEITIINPADAKEDFHYAAYVAPYSVMGEEYGADLATESNYTMITKWIKIEEPEGAVKPNESKKVKYTITVPENAPAGGQYAAIIVSQNPEEMEQQSDGVAVRDVFEMASLVYADIEGETVHEGEILENNVPQFVLSAPITVGALLKNDGNVHETAAMVLAVKDVFTGNVLIGEEQKNNNYTEVVMPETTRYARREISENLPVLGIVNVKQTIYYNGQTSEVEQNVVICPIWFMALVGAVVALLIAVVVRIILKHRKKKNQVI